MNDIPRQPLILAQFATTVPLYASDNLLWPQKHFAAIDERFPRHVLAAAITLQARGDEVACGVVSRCMLGVEMVESDLSRVCTVKVTEAVQTSEPVSEIDREALLFAYPA